MVRVIDDTVTERGVIAVLQVLRPDCAHVDDAKVLFEEYARTLDVDLSFQNFDDEMARFPWGYLPPEGALLVAKLEDCVVGCVAMRKMTADICEMKRLYVRKEARGLKLGERLVRAIMEVARDAGYGSMRLDTLPTMHQAQALYEQFSFEAVEPYYYNPVPGTRFLEARLG